MATAYRAEYVTLGGLLLGSRALDCFDWSELMGVAPKRGRDLVIPGAAGVTVRSRVEGAMRPFLRVRINGTYDQDNAVSFTTEATKRSNFWTLLNLLRAKAEVNTTQTVQLTTASTSYSADSIVEWMSPPKWNKGDPPWIATVTVELTLPDGGLV